MPTGRATSAGANTRQASLSRSTDLVGMGFSTPPPDLNQASVGWGQAASTPAVWSDLAHSHSVALQTADRLAIDNDHSSFDVTVLGADLSGCVVGGRLWYVYMPVNPPISGTVLTNPIDMGLVVA